MAGNSWREAHGGKLMARSSWREAHGGKLMAGSSWRKTHGGKLMAGNSWRETASSKCLHKMQRHKHCGGREQANMRFFVDSGAIYPGVPTCGSGASEERWHVRKAGGRARCAELKRTNSSQLERGSPGSGPPEASAAEEAAPSVELHSALALSDIVNGCAATT